MTDLRIPPYDPALEPGLRTFLEAVERVPLRRDTIVHNRQHFESFVRPIEEQLADLPVDVDEVRAPGPKGAPELALTVVRPRSADRPACGRPAVYQIHGGGLVLGNRHFGVDDLGELVVRFGAVGVSVEYRLAPENPAPAAAEDCYAGLLWLADQAADLGVDPTRVLVTGASAGGGLSAAVALMARDRHGPPLAGQLLDCPMLDDRNDTVSAHQFDGRGAWDRANNATAWDAVLGTDRGSDAVSPYVAPARARDLSGLPPAFVAVGSAEVFRDEAVDYASRIWTAGGHAELHVWSGGYHGFTGFSPDTIAGQAASMARLSWLDRVLGVSRALSV